MISFPQLFYTSLAKMEASMRQQIDAGLTESYAKAVPFPHMAFDGFFNPYIVQELFRRFPRPSDDWWVYNNPLEQKFALNDVTKMDPLFVWVIQTLCGQEFIGFLERLSGIRGLIPDPLLNGGGLHQITRGGKLDIHADYNYHPVTGLDRRVNVLLYLNADWKAEWGGELQLWDSEMKVCQKAYLPEFNRMVVFSTTDKAFHGHPDPLRTPSGEKRTRKSIALYFYTNGRPECEKTAPHSTLYQKRPQDKEDPNMDELRKIRARGRLTADVKK